MDLVSFGKNDNFITNFNKVNENECKQSDAILVRSESNVVFRT